MEKEIKHNSIRRAMSEEEIKKFRESMPKLLLGKAFFKRLGDKTKVYMHDE